MSITIYYILLQIASDSKASVSSIIDEYLAMPVQEFDCLR